MAARGMVCAIGATALTVILTSGLAACGSAVTARTPPPISAHESTHAHTTETPTSSDPGTVVSPHLVTRPNPDPAIARADASSTPKGWKRYAYGMMSVAVPPTWSVLPAPLTAGQGCDVTPTPPRTVSTYFQNMKLPVVQWDCPNGQVPTGPDVTDAVTIWCYVGPVSHLVSGGRVLRKVANYKLRQDTTASEGVYLQGPAGQGGVTAYQTGSNQPPAPDDPGPKIMASVVPTGQPCN